MIAVADGLTVSVAAGRSDVAAQLSGRGEDERSRVVNLRVGAMTGNVPMLARPDPLTPHRHTLTFSTFGITDAVRDIENERHSSTPAERQSV
ncbi:hypothetical protein [Streptomyces alanosinicus]|uniref:Uncharacterized protein n=1 Tax=Streptomyces alanosinicus TaxID=68171 RepID=A0A918YFK1_9ACTN|nr:hypothetical protein [Streptomyces alanosinicus]GHE01285.1 hypothetical protein GCM10010339_19880 [Streptomyces alanosinicus]